MSWGPRHSSKVVLPLHAQGEAPQDGDAIAAPEPTPRLGSGDAARPPIRLEIDPRLSDVGAEPGVLRAAHPVPMPPVHAAQADQLVAAAEAGAAPAERSSERPDARVIAEAELREADRAAAAETFESAGATEPIGAVAEEPVPTAATAEEQALPEVTVEEPPTEAPTFVAETLQPAPVEAAVEALGREIPLEPAPWQVVAPPALPEPPTEQLTMSPSEETWAAAPAAASVEEEPPVAEESVVADSPQAAEPVQQVSRVKTLPEAPLPVGPSPASGPDVGDRPGPLISGAWLMEHLYDARLKVVHVSTDRKIYDQQHIEDAAFGDLHTDLARRGREAATGDVDREYLLPDRVSLERTLARWKVGPDDRIVFYDDSGQNRHAVRAYWLLRYYGWPAGRVHVLDGGLWKWQEDRGEVTDALPGHERSAPVWLRDPDPSLLASLPQVAGWSRETAEAGPIRLLDVRSEAEYRGDDVRARRGGHIPGAVRLEWSDFLTGEGTFRSREEIVALADRVAGGDAGSLRATYCQGGVRAALAWFALQELAGLDVRNYAPSWEEWGNRTDTLVETA